MVISVKDTSGMYASTLVETIKRRRLQARIGERAGGQGVEEAHVLCRDHHRGCVARSGIDSSAGRFGRYLTCSRSGSRSHFM